MEQALSPSLSSSQGAPEVDTGTVSGYVLDPSERAVPNAAIRIESVARSWVRTGHSSDLGSYEFDGLPPAAYHLSVNADSFAPLTTQAIRVEVDQRIPRQIRFALRLKF